MSSPLDDLLAGLPGCARLGAGALAALAAASRVEEFPASVRLLVEGEPAPDWYGIVEAGSVQVSRADLDADGIRDHLTAGEVLDPGAPGLPAACSASTVETTRCRFVPQSEVARHRDLAAPDLATMYRGNAALFVRQVSDLIKGPPVTCGVEASVAEAAQLMTRRRVGSVIVVAADGAPIGIVTDRDLRAKILAQGNPSTTPVGRIMSSPLIAVEPDGFTFEAPWR